MFIKQYKSLSHAHCQLLTLKHRRLLYSEANTIGADLRQHLIHLVCNLCYSHSNLWVVGSCLSQEHWQVGVRRGNGWWCAYNSRGHRKHLLGANCLLGNQRVQLSLHLYICRWAICSLQRVTRQWQNICGTFTDECIINVWKTTIPLINRALGRGSE
jgi:hypothetical protein